MRRAVLARFRRAGWRLGVASASFVLLSCTERATWPEAAPPVPPSLDDGWPVGSPSSQGLDPQRLSLLDHDLRSRRIEEVDALLIARRGVLVYEGYFGSATSMDRPHQLNSATKSVASLLVGAAEHRGLLVGFEQPIAELFPEAQDLFDAEPTKRDITLRHVLTMTAGLDWDHEDVRSRERDDIYINRAPDAIRYVLEKPLVAKPGIRFDYNSGCSMLLTGLIPNVSGLEAGPFADEYLFGPLGIRQYSWRTTDDGTARGQDGLSMRGRDLLKLGQLVLQDGLWEGRRIISSDWIEASLQPWTSTDWPHSRYGFQWWLVPYAPSGDTQRPYGLVLASGYGGQKLYIVPELELTAVFYGCTTEGYDCGISDSVPEAVMYDYVLSAVED